MAFSGNMDESDKIFRNEKILYSNNRFTNKSSPLMGSDSSSSSSPITLPETLNDNNQLFSWAEMYGSLKQADSQSSVVPLLELGSRSSTINYLRELDGAKLIREPQMAFESWYAHKQRLHQQKLQIQRKELEKKRAEEEDRKKLSKLRYEQWLRNKQRQASKNHLKNLSNQNNLQQVSIPSSKECCSSVDNAVSESPTKIKINNKSNMSQAEIRQVVQSWWLKKMEQQKRQRQDKQRRLVKKKIEDQRRKKLVDQAWQTWISNVHTKPKPVPLNQGIQSLRGTISPLYINPEPWKRLNDTTESGIIKKMAR